MSYFQGGSFFKTFMKMIVLLIFQKDILLTWEFSVIKLKIETMKLDFVPAGSEWAITNC